MSPYPHFSLFLTSLDSLWTCGVAHTHPEVTLMRTGGRRHWGSAASDVNEQPQPPGHRPPGACQETGRASVYSCSPSLSHRPQMGPSRCRKASSGLALILHYGELCDYFVIYHNVNSNRNKVHSKCNVLESSGNHPCLHPLTSQPRSVEKLSSAKPAPDWGPLTYTLNKIKLN